MSYRLHIIMRTDMKSMNAGKGMAQAAHAANDMAAEVGGIAAWEPSLVEWQNQAENFGTTLVFGANIADISAVLDDFAGRDACSAEIIDPSYPIRDGEVTHHISVVTCAWVFCDEKVWQESFAARNLKLHK